MFNNKNNIFKRCKTMNDVLYLVKQEVCQAHFIKPLFITDDRSSDNMMYLPHGSGFKKNEIDEEIKELIRNNEADEYDCQLIYKNKSLIPSKLVITAKKDKKEVYFKELLIWV